MYIWIYMVCFNSWNKWSSLFSIILHTKYVWHYTHTHTHTHTLHTLRHVGLRKRNEGKSDRTLLLSQNEAFYKGSESYSVVSSSLWPWTFSRPEYWSVGSLSLLQGIFPTQGLSLGLPHCRQILYQLSHKGSPTTLEWAACPFSKGSSQPRNWTRVSCIAGRFFTNWATREAQSSPHGLYLYKV